MKVKTNTPRARRGPPHRPRTAPLRARRRLPDLRPQRRLRAAQARPRPGHRRDPLRGREDRKHHRHLHPGPACATPASASSCRRCVTVCNEIQGVGALFAAGPRLQDRHRPGLRQQPERRRLRAVRPVRRGLPGRRHHREQRPSTRSGRPSTTRRKHVIVQTAPAIRAALGEEFGYRAGHPRHRQDGRGPARASASTACSTPTSPPTSPSWRKAPSC